MRVSLIGGIAGHRWCDVASLLDVRCECGFHGNRHQVVAHVEASRTASKPTIQSPVAFTVFDEDRAIDLALALAELVKDGPDTSRILQLVATGLAVGSAPLRPGGEARADGCPDAHVAVALLIASAAAAAHHLGMTPAQLENYTRLAWCNLAAASARVSSGGAA